MAKGMAIERIASSIRTKGNVSTRPQIAFIDPIMRQVLHAVDRNAYRAPRSRSY